MTEITAQSIDEALRKQLDAAEHQRRVSRGGHRHPGRRRHRARRRPEATPWPASCSSSSERAARPSTAWPRTSKRTKSAPCFWVTSPQSRRTTRSARPVVSWRFPSASAMLGRVVNPLGHADRRQGPHQGRGHAPGGVQGSRRHLPPARERADADRYPGHRLHDRRSAAASAS